MNIRIDKNGKPLSGIAAVLMLAALIVGCKHNVSTELETPPPVQKYTVTLTQPVHGTVTADPAIPSDNQIEKDTEITFTAKAETGYEVDTWTIRPTDVLIADEQSGNTTAKVKITANTTVTVTFKMQAPVGTYVKVPFGTNGEKLDTYLKNNASEAHINYIEVTGLTAGALKGKFVSPASYEPSSLGKILETNWTKKVALKFGGSIAELTDMSRCFLRCTSLMQAPEIPENVTNMSFCFAGCERLVHAPEIPENVTDMSYCFSNCKSLVHAPEIPENVTNMSYCFRGCTSLVQAPAIPASVTDMWGCFSHCKSLTQAPEIPENVTNMSYCFSNCTKLISVTLKCNYNNDKDSHGNFHFCGTFQGCSSLMQGMIKVPVGQFETYKANAGIMGTTADRFAKDE